MGGTGEAEGRLYLEWLPHRCRGRWQRASRPERTSRGVEVTWGTLTDSRWYYEVVKDGGDETRPYPDEQAALAVAAAWMRRLGGQWEQLPCYPTHGWQDGERQDQPPCAGS